MFTKLELRMKTGQVQTPWVEAFPSKVVVQLTQVR